MIIKKRNKSFLLLFVPLLLLTGITTAYLTGFDKEENAFGVGKNTVHIIEDFPDPVPKPEQEKVQYKKIVTISNKLDGPKGFQTDCYIRALISYSDSDIGKAVTLLGEDTSMWEYNNNDGFYYYKSVVREGESTTPLMTGFQINKNRIEENAKDRIDHFEINIYTESVGAMPGESWLSTWQKYLGRNI